jgi:hypothetical protein
MVDSLANAFNLVTKLHSRSATIERPGSSELVNGVVPSISASLTSNISEGLVYIEGVRIVIPITSNTYTLSKDTYLDITPIGILTFIEVANGTAAPAITALNIRIAKIVTDATSITSVVMLRTPKAIYKINPVNIRITPGNYSRNLGAPEEIIITGREFVISKKNLDEVYFPSLKRGDRIKDSELGYIILSDINEMYGFGGSIIGYRVRSS